MYRELVCWLWAGICGVGWDMVGWHVCIVCVDTVGGLAGGVWVVMCRVMGYGLLVGLCVVCMYVSCVGRTVVGLDMGVS